MSDRQREQFIQLGVLFTEINAQVNLVSRKDMEGFYERHVLHSLAIAKYSSFMPGTRIMDLGTGGGLPGIPLAIMFPEVEFVLVDSIRKKISAVNSMRESLQLLNVNVLCDRAENVKKPFDFVVTRAVATLPVLSSYASKTISTKQVNTIPNGIIALKGGDLTEEMRPFGRNCMAFAIQSWFSESFFESKSLLHCIRN
ncbi:MAG: 16S rRNA (guanine(527)-N(7))-methyltransferase RsmG [Flavobacteriales bacterium]